MRCTSRTIAVLLVALAAPGAARSPAADPSGTAAAPASPAVDAGAAIGLASRAQHVEGRHEGQGLHHRPRGLSVGELVDGQLVVTGSVTDSGGPSGAMWSSRDGRKWKRAKLKAAEGAIVFAIARAGTTVVATGAGGDGTGLLWTSTDGSPWGTADAPEGVMYGLIASDAGGFVAAGVQDGAAMAWLSRTVWRGRPRSWPRAVGRCTPRRAWMGHWW